LSVLILLAVSAAPSSALAQLQPGQSQLPNTPAPQPDKEDGPAEAAPKDDTALPTTPVLPPRKSERANYQLFELDGYFRWRGDWLNKFNLGFRDDPDEGGAPFATPLACADQSPDKPCRSKFKSSNLRLRLEPVISLRENATQIFMQIDVLDNVVLGSTPAAFTGDPSSSPGGLGEGVVAPIAGNNSSGDSLVVKRAWAEVETSLGRIHFGRMPWHWGVGIYANGGGRDPIHGTYDLDSDFGTTVDRLQFARNIPGTDLDASIAMDWTSSFPSSEQLGLFRTQGGGQPFDLEDNDDTNQWVFTIARMDRPREFAERVERGELTLNYGAFFAYRTQSWEQTNLNVGQVPDPLDFVRRGVKAYIPDVSSSSRAWPSSGRWRASPIWSIPTPTTP
jgi:uncharacterized protein (TIGR04551 family)